MLKLGLKIISYHPLLTSLPLFFIYCCVESWKPGLIKNKLRIADKNLIIICLIIILNYIIMLGLYASHSNFSDHIEPNIASVSWLFQTGKTLYHDLESSEVYSLPYGLMLYVINGFFLKLFQPSISVAKLGGVFSSLFSLLFILFTFKKLSGTRISIICCAYITLIFISLDSGGGGFIASAFWNRAEPIILMFVSLSLLGIVQTPPLIATLLCALSLGISLNIKIYSFIFHLFFTYFCIAILSVWNFL